MCISGYYDKRRARPCHARRLVQSKSRSCASSSRDVRGRTRVFLHDARDKRRETRSARKFQFSGGRNLARYRCRFPPTSRAVIDGRAWNNVEKSRRERKKKRVSGTEKERKMRKKRNKREAASSRDGTLLKGFFSARVKTCRIFPQPDF